MQNYENAMNIMTERFGKDSLIAIATTDGERLYNRVVDAYYENGAFYVSTYALSNKIKQIEMNTAVLVLLIVRIIIPDESFPEFRPDFSVLRF